MKLTGGKKWGEVEKFGRKCSLSYKNVVPAHASSPPYIFYLKPDFIKIYKLKSVTFSTDLRTISYRTLGVHSLLYINKVNMKIVTNVKGVTDFGKRSINDSLYEYSQHYPRVEKGDILLYYYPQDNAMGIYIADRELEYYSRDGFQYCRGTMIRYSKSAMEFCEELQQTDPQVALAVIKELQDISEKYSKQ